MWDRGLHSYAMVQATLAKGCEYLGRVPANVKFVVEETLDDGSYLSWIAPSGKLKRKGCQRIRVRGKRIHNRLPRPAWSPAELSSDHQRDEYRAIFGPPAGV